MKKVASLFMLVIALLGTALVGCSNTETDFNPSKNNQIKSQESASFVPSQTFQSGNVTMVGERGKIGILGPEFESGKVNKYMWHFWGEDAAKAKKFKVIGVSKEHGEAPVLARVNESNVATNVWEYESLSGTINGADAHTPSNVLISKPGLWRLDVFFDEKFFGSVVVDVQGS